MPAAIVQSTSGAQNTPNTIVTATFASATAGNVIVATTGSDDYKTGDPSGWTLSTGMSQQTFLGHYLYWKLAAGGETSMALNVGSAVPASWAAMEISGLDPVSPYDVSNGQLVTGGALLHTTPTITPSAGERFVVASMGGSWSGGSLTVDTWLNGFVEQQDICTTLGGGTRDLVSLATLAMTANGSTGIDTGATYSDLAQSRTGLIIAFKVAAAATGRPPRRNYHTAAVRRASTW